MTTFPLHLRSGHLFLETDGELWLLDTGAPASFGARPLLNLAGEQFQLDGSYLGLSAATLSRLVSVECVGLLGGDVLAGFDCILDAPHGTVMISTDELACARPAVPLDEFMGIPIVSVRICGVDYRMFLDTGAQISYFQHESIVSFPAAGRMTDFYPGAGQFQTETYNVAITIGGAEFTLCCGVLPELLAATLMMAGTEGIIGNQVFRDRSVGYFPRRRLLAL